MTTTETTRLTGQESRYQLPSGVDIETATAGGAYTVQEVHEDTIAFGDWVVDGTWFFSTQENCFYRLTSDHAPYTFTLERAIQLHPQSTKEDNSNTVSNPDPYPIHSVTELGAEILSGDLHGVPPGKTIEFGTAHLSNTGEYLILQSSESGLTSVAEIDFEAFARRPRYTDGSPYSLLTTIDEQELAQTRNEGSVLAYSVNGSKSGITHLLPMEDDQSPHTTPELETSITSDGGAVLGVGNEGNNPVITEIPYFPTEDPDMVTRFVPTSRHVAETFQEPNLRKYALAYMEGRVLNACAGPTDLSEWYADGEITRNDLHPDVKSDLSVDIAELACHFEPNSFDTIVFDPPWTAYQSRMRYDGYVVHKKTSDNLPVNQINIDVRDLPFKVPGEDAIGDGIGGAQLTLGEDYSELKETDETAITSTDNSMTNRSREYIQPDTKKEQIGHARLAKLGFDYLLKPGGRVIQFAYTGSVMPSALDYTRLDRTAFDPTGTYRTLIGGVDQKNSPE